MTLTNKLAHSGRLSPEVGDKIRKAIQSLLEGSDQEKVARRIGMSKHGMENILAKRSNGSLATAIGVAAATKTPLADLIGETLALVAENQAKKERVKKYKEAKEAKPVSPPPPLPRKASSFKKPSIEQAEEEEETEFQEQKFKRQLKASFRPEPVEHTPPLGMGFYRPLEQSLLRRLVSGENISQVDRELIRDMYLALKFENETFKDKLLEILMKD